MSYYKRIRELREDHDLTQRQVANYLSMPQLHTAVASGRWCGGQWPLDAAECTQPQYFRYEQGYRDIPTDILIALADYYNTSTDYILGRTNNPAPPHE